MSESNAGWALVPASSGLAGIDEQFILIPSETNNQSQISLEIDNGKPPSEAVSCDS